MFMSDVARRQRKIKIRPPEFESDFIKKIATRIGINNLTRESVAYISTQVTYELMFIVQVRMYFNRAVYLIILSYEFSVTP